MDGAWAVVVGAAIAAVSGLAGAALNARSQKDQTQQLREAADQHREDLRYQLREQAREQQEQLATQLLAARADRLLEIRKDAYATFLQCCLALHHAYYELTTELWKHPTDRERHEPLWQRLWGLEEAAEAAYTAVEVAGPDPATDEAKAYMRAFRKQIEAGSTFYSNAPSATSEELEELSAEYGRLANRTQAPWDKFTKAARNVMEKSVSERPTIPSLD